MIFRCFVLKTRYPPHIVCDMHTNHHIFIHLHFDLCIHSIRLSNLRLIGSNSRYDEKRILSMKTCGIFCSSQKKKVLTSSVASLVLSSNFLYLSIC